MPSRRPSNEPIQDPAFRGKNTREETINGPDATSHRPHPIFTDRDGSPLDNGFLYFGVAGLNPETNPIQVYYDINLTQPAAQPLRTSNGYVMRNGAPALIYANAQFSVTVRDKSSQLVTTARSGLALLLVRLRLVAAFVIRHLIGDGV